MSNNINYKEEYEKLLVEHTKLQANHDALVDADNKRKADTLHKQVLDAINVALDDENFISGNVRNIALRGVDLSDIQAFNDDLDNNIKSVIDGLKNDCGELFNIVTTIGNPPATPPTTNTDIKETEYVGFFD